jgi:hypothetical protein
VAALAARRPRQLHPVVIRRLPLERQSPARPEPPFRLSPPLPL